MSDEMELYDSEVQSLLEILGKLQVKYGSRKATFENLNSMQSEAMDMCEKAGFLVTVSIFDDNMHPKLPPEITVHGRVDADLFAGFDPERQQWEAKNKVADEGKVKEFLAKGGTEGQAVEVQSEVTETEKQAE